MEIYRVLFDPKKDKGIYALSVVNDPAMEEMFISLNKDEQPKEIDLQLAEVNKEQRILLGVALVPDKPVYRNVEGKEFYITFPSETIKAAAHSFLTNQHNNNSSIEHELKLSGMSVVESWIVEDPDNDKSNIYGLKAPKNSWVAAMKVDNDEIWNDYVKTGKIKGFSIDGLFSLEKLENEQIKTEMTKEQNTIVKAIQDGITELKAFFSPKTELKAETKVELANATLQDGTVIQYDGELSEGTEIMVVVEDAEPTPAPDGEHVLEDGTVVKTVEGKVTEIVPVSDEDTSEADVLEELKKQLDELGVSLKGQIDNLQVELTTKDTKIKELEAQLSKTPATKPIKHTSVELSTDRPTTRKERLKLALQKNR